MEKGVFRNSLFRDPNMNPELRVATLEGNVSSLHKLLAKDELLLKNFMTENDQETPLHIAAILGHLEFVIEVLAQEAELAIKQDSQGSTPLHLAATKGYFNIVVSLLTINPDLCFVRDKEKRNPLHVVAMKGHMDVLEFLVWAKPDAARDKVKDGQTILHLCMKHGRLEVLKLFIDILGDEQFINSRDENGHMILHLAATDGQTKTIDFLIDKGVDPKIKNSRGLTALRILARGEVNRKERKRKWQNNMHKTLMVVATLLAAMAFQASITPPGGLWQEDPSGDENHPAPNAAEPTMDYDTAHYAGESIMGTKYPVAYKFFIICNTISMVASLSIIILLISGLPLKRGRITTWTAMLTMWVAVTFTAATYAISILTFTPKREWYTVDYIVGKAVLAWVALMALIFLCHIIRLFLKLVRKVLKLVRKTSTRRRPESITA